MASERVDANLRYLYTGEQKKLGTPRKYDGKVDCHDLSRLNFVKEIKPGVSLYTLVVGELLFKLPNLRKLVSLRFKPTGQSKMLDYLALNLALIFTYRLSKLLNILRLVFRANLFFVMPSNLRDCLIVKLVIYQGLIFILMPVLLP
ncbi:hypothetical protein [Microcoleus vaginatus]|uniref:hypothetical protein n=1 Tax=Microcoleus vaginatus TaxID=119532 RepID=UPI0016890589|nr:hypothetical protein [Microcoleus sp. FACHB-84]MBD2008056.1 hypothetical protein [Microcoleus sp. FACHB-45]